MKTETPSDYDKLECPECDMLCKPVKIRKNGTVIYETNECNNGDYHFEIDIDGDLVED